MGGRGELVRSKTSAPKVPEVMNQLTEVRKLKPGGPTYLPPPPVAWNKQCKHFFSKFSTQCIHLEVLTGTLT